MRAPTRLCAVSIGFVAAFGGTPVVAQTPVPRVDGHARTAGSEAKGKPSTPEPPAGVHQPRLGPSGWTWAPGAQPLLPPRVGDLRHARASLRLISSLRWHRPQFDISAGGQVPVLRYVSEGESRWAFEAEAFGAFFMRTDLEHDTDVIGTDGYFGLPLVLAWGDWVAKLEIGHVSSHLGDETITATGRRPINYSKEELVPGLTWLGPFGFRVYAEAAYAVRMGIERGPHRERPWRFQWGVDWVARAWRVPIMAGWDFESREEVGYNVTSHLEFGFLIAGTLQGANTRVAFSWLVGRSVLKQNHDKRSQWWSIGIVSDL